MTLVKIDLEAVRRHKGISDYGSLRMQLPAKEDIIYLFARQIGLHGEESKKEKIGESVIIEKNTLADSDVKQLVEEGVHLTDIVKQTNYAYTVSDIIILCSNGIKNTEDIIERGAKGLSRGDNFYGNDTVIECAVLYMYNVQKKPIPKILEWVKVYVEKCSSEIFSMTHWHGIEVLENFKGSVPVKYEGSESFSGSSLSMGGYKESESKGTLNIDVKKGEAYFEGDTLTVINPKYPTSKMEWELDYALTLDSSSSSQYGEVGGMESKSSSSMECRPFSSVKHKKTPLPYRVGNWFFEYRNGALKLSLPKHRHHNHIGYVYIAFAKAVLGIRDGINDGSEYSFDN